MFSDLPNPQQKTGKSTGLKTPVRSDKSDTANISESMQDSDLLKHSVPSSTSEQIKNADSVKSTEKSKQSAESKSVPQKPSVSDSSESTKVSQASEQSNLSESSNSLGLLKLADHTNTSESLKSKELLKLSELVQTPNQTKLVQQNNSDPPEEVPKSKTSEHKKPQEQAESVEQIKSDPFHISNISHPLVNLQPLKSAKQSPMINIFPWYKRWNGDTVKFWYREGLGPRVFASCPVKRCQIVDDLSQSDAVLISHKFLWTSDAKWMKKFKLPVYRTPTQKWVFVSNEPPSFRPVAPQYLRLFNMTFTYTFESDVHYPYGFAVRRQTPRNNNADDVGSWRYNPHWSSKQDVAWVVSNCRTLSGRERYVKELAKYINVTIYGACGTNRINCTRSEGNYNNLDCYHNIEQKFKFYLSFENSLCRDYTSEKFWRTLQQNMIPVVYGLYNYKYRAPPNSYIDVTDFESPKKLAEYLKKVSGDRALYDSYMAWKKRRDVVTDTFKAATCSLCARLHETKHAPPKTVDLSNFWGGETNCIPASDFLKVVGVQNVIP